MSDLPRLRKLGRFPRVRFSVATLLIAVAVTGTVLGTVMERRARFLRIAEQHRSQITGARGAWVMMSGPSGRICRRVYRDAKGNVVPAEKVAKDPWHRTMSDKYFRAASQPWYPVGGDPAEPWPESRNAATALD
jgi:hypothetical protein